MHADMFVKEKNTNIDNFLCMDVSFINRHLYEEKYMHLYIFKRKYGTDNFIFFLDMLIQLFLGNSYNFRNAAKIQITWKLRVTYRKSKPQTCIY